MRHACRLTKCPSRLAAQQRLNTALGTMMKCIAFLLAAFVSLSAAAGSPYKLESIMLLQPDFVLSDRVPSIDALSNYVKAVETATIRTLNEEAPYPASGFIVLAVRPDESSKVWFDFKPALPAETASRLSAAIQAVKPFPSRNGTVVFALNATLWGAPPRTGSPNPPEWNEATKGLSDPVEIGDLVDRLLWPEEAGTKLGVQADR
jgi:hypothetical protein